jgi:UDP-3-O-[3-hydroxymyristoyl] glucosamine N-acyltransferase
MPISLGELATRFGCELVGDPDVEVHSVATLSNAGPGCLTFLSNSAYKKQLSSTKAAVVVLRAADAADCSIAALISDDPYSCYARIATLLYPSPALRPGIHASAVVEGTAKVAASAQIDALAFVGERSVIGENTYIGPGCVIGPDCVIGDSCRFIANVTLPRKVVIGDRGLFHPGAVIGGDGFGNAVTATGWVKVPQVGGVLIGNDVEIGSNTTVDCGAIDDTVIEDGVRIDNLCQISHNVRIGAHTAMAGASGISGSSVVGKRCLLAGQSGLVGHISICDDTVIGAKAMITMDIKEPGVYVSNFPAEPAKIWNRRVAQFRRLDSLLKRVKKIEMGEK